MIFIQSFVVLPSVVQWYTLKSGVFSHVQDIPPVSAIVFDTYTCKFYSILSIV